MTNKNPAQIFGKKINVFLMLPALIKKKGTKSLFINRAAFYSSFSLKHKRRLQMVRLMTM
jgi:hypothetical protein